MFDVPASPLLRRLLIVIVNYRTAHLTIAALRSLSHELPQLPETHVVVVDNDSQDGSVDTIRQAINSEQWQAWATVLPADRNGGFAYGNNLAIRQALAEETPPDYFLLLNPDTQVRPGAVTTLLNFLEQNPKAGMAGSSFETAEGSPWQIAFRFPNVLSELESGLQLGLATRLLSRWTVVQKMGKEPTAVDWLSGACIMVRRNLIEEIGLLDEQYFLYFEETDFCLRAKQAGWSNWYVPESRVMHMIGQSTGFKENIRPKRRPQYWFESRQRFFIKNYGLLYTALADIAWMTGFILWQGRRVIQRKPDLNPPYLLQDFWRNSVLLKAVSRKAN